MFHYLSANSVAILVLGHLAVREREPGHQLVSFWAPFVLVHLGGQDTITAFSRQDNELWLRHLLNLVTQVAVAGYVVAKASWPDVRLRAAMIITFVSGSIKYAERTLCLYLASPEKVRSNAQNDLSKLQTPDFQPSSLTSYVFDCILEGRYPGNDSGRRETYFFSVDAPQNMLQSTTCANDVPGILQRKFVSNPSRYKSYVYVGEYLEIFYQYRYTKYPLRQMFYYELYEANYIVPAWARKRWSEELAQYSMIKSQCAAVQAYTIRQWIRKYFGSPITVSTIKKLILDNLLHFGTRAEWNCSSSRGQLALRKWKAAAAGSALDKSTSSGVDFSTSVLIWHIATDMRYYTTTRDGDSSSICSDDDRVKTTKERKEMSRQLSSYIIYLVFNCGVMCLLASQGNNPDEKVAVVTKLLLEGGNNNDDADGGSDSALHMICGRRGRGELVWPKSSKDNVDDMGIL
uniref:DUF4220 domain-containing protein n=2 Tax=Oryza sativa subsp. japonica TaxID=39947 RepID=Q2QMS4_ORYSJ|nr:hypothetical protein LOC_Os12g40200 [Oryza sativa Japonica Group]